MSILVLRHDHDLSYDAARQRVALFERKLTEYGVTITWRGKTGDIAGTGFSGTVELSDGFVEIRIKLGFLARRVVDVPRLEGAISKRLALAFGDEPPEVP